MKRSVKSVYQRSQNDRATDAQLEHSVSATKEFHAEKKKGHALERRTLRRRRTED
jgi:hypothetical protein